MKKGNRWRNAGVRIAGRRQPTRNKNYKQKEIMEHGRGGLCYRSTTELSLGKATRQGREGVSRCSRGETCLA